MTSIFWRRVFAVFSGNLAGAGLAFVMAGVIVSKGGLENYGLFALLQSIYFTWSVLSRPLTWQTIVRHSDGRNNALLIAHSIRAEFVGATVCCLVAAPLVVLLLRDPGVIGSAAPSGMSILFIALGATLVNSGTVCGYLRASGDFWLLSAINTGLNALKLLFSLALYDDIETFFNVTVVLDLLAWGGALLWVRKKARPTLERSEGEPLSFRQFLKFSYWGTLHACLDLPVAQLDRVLIAWLVGLDATGAISLIRRMAQIIGNVVDPVCQVMFPMFTKLYQEGDREEIRKRSRQMTIAILVIGMGVVLLIYATFDQINSLMFSARLSQHETTLLAFMLVYVLGCSTAWVHPLFITLGLMRHNTYILAAANTTYLWFIYQFGVEFGIWAMITGFAAQVAIATIPKYLIIRTRLAPAGP